MARQRYTITVQDYLTVLGYLKSKQRNFLDWPTDDNFKKISSEEELRLFRDPVTLNAWCEKWLSREQWQKLKTAARAARRRSRNSGMYAGIPDFSGVRVKQAVARILANSYFPTWPTTGTWQAH